MISVRSDDLTEKIIRIKNWNIVNGWSDIVWWYSLNNSLITIFLLLSIFHSIFCYLTKHGFKENQLPANFDGSWWFLHRMKKVWFT